MFTSILNDGTGNLTLLQGILCTGCSLLLGLWIAFIYTKQGSGSKSFRISIAILPAIVQSVIMMVNGNLGTGVAVLGTFSLVRFRSVPGSSKEILFIFFAMAIGLATGMGNLSFALFTAIVISAAFLLYSHINLFQGQLKDKELRIIIPEDLDYTEIFDDIFVRYVSHVEIIRVKTINLGSMFEILYHITMKDVHQEKAMIDEIRCRNGNLAVISAKRQANSDEL